MTATLTTGAKTTRVLATLAAAGIAGAALTACSPDEHAATSPGTTPPVITGNQVIPGDLVNADDVPAEAGAATGTAALLGPTGDSVGVASFVAEGHSTKINLRVTDLREGVHAVEVRSGNSCVAQREVAIEGGDATAVAGPGGFTGTGNVIAGGSLPGISVDAEGNGSARQSVSVDISNLDGKALVVLTGDTPVACGIIAAN